VKNNFDALPVPQPQEDLCPPPTIQSTELRSEEPEVPAPPSVPGTLLRRDRSLLRVRGLRLPAEKLLRCKVAPEFISYSEWESEAAIKAYRNSQAHQEIVRHARALKGAKAEVKLYDVVQ
jgi:hypothetical protein